MTPKKVSSSSTRTKTTGNSDDGAVLPDGSTQQQRHDQLVEEWFTISKRITDPVPWLWLKELVMLSGLLLSLMLLRFSVLISTMLNSQDYPKGTTGLGSYLTGMYRRLSSWLR